MPNVIYSVFVSSVYETLEKERAVVIDFVLDSGKLPICMEHFTVGKFDGIQRLMDYSDFIILIMGNRYGSCNLANGKSWTQLEYEYAVKVGKNILVLVCEDLDQRVKRCAEEPLFYDSLPSDEQQQIDFYKVVQQDSFSRVIADTNHLQTVLLQYFSHAPYANCLGWKRGAAMNPNELAKWQQAHRVFHAAGTWYHVLLSKTDKKYIRVGTVNIQQKFTPSDYGNLYLDACNYGVQSVSKKEEKLVENRFQRSWWHGNFAMDAEGMITGIFHVQREFDGQYDDQNIRSGKRRGIMDLKIDVTSDQPLDFFQGEFHDEAPSPKYGFVYLFRSPQERFAFLMSTKPKLMKRLMKKK